MARTTDRYYIVVSAPPQGGTENALKNESRHPNYVGRVSSTGKRILKVYVPAGEDPDGNLPPTWNAAIKSPVMGIYYHPDNLYDASNEPWALGSALDLVKEPEWSSEVL